MSILLVWSGCAQGAPGDPASMTRTTSKMQFPDLGPAQEQLELVFPRIADPTEKLKAILNTALLTLARPGLSHRSGNGPSPIVRVKHQSGEIDQRPGPFNQAIHIIQLVLDRLERPNRHTELLSLSGVVEV